jgi:hypothetical protein
VTEVDDVTFALLPLADYAEAMGKSLRTVQRWLADGELPDAQQDEDGRWWVPAGTRRRTSSRDVVGAAAGPARELAAAPASSGSPLGMLGTLEDAAAALGTTTGGVRRMARDGHLVVGPYGPNGALRVYLPPRV